MQKGLMMDTLPEKKAASPYLAAVVQAASVYGDVDATLHKVDVLAAEAQRRGAKLAVFPEGFIGGYPKGHTFGSYVGGRTDGGREAYRRYWESAIDVPGPVVDRLGKIACEHHLTLVIGVIERDVGTLYCCVLFFDADGTCLGKHRKLMPTGAERLIWGFGDGSTLPVFDSPLGRIGAVICWENYMPLLRMAMYAKGIQIYCAPTADPRDSWLASMRHIAIEGRCFVLACNQYLLRHHVAPDAPNALGEAPDTVLQRGGSCIVNPFGDILAGPDYDGEAVIVAEIDTADIARGKFDFDVTGHYARPDIFQLQVNERPQRPVMIGPATQ
jgi:nitrilase